MLKRLLFIGLAVACAFTATSLVNLARTKKLLIFVKIKTIKIIEMKQHKRFYRFF